MACTFGILQCTHPTPTAPPGPCARTSIAGQRLPHVLPEQLNAQYWIARSTDVDRVWLDQTAIQHWNRYLASPQSGVPLFDLQNIDPTVIKIAVQRRLNYLEKQLLSKQYIFPLPLREMPALSLPDDWLTQISPTFFTSTGLVTLHCFPIQHRILKTKDPQQLNRNLCSTAGPGETLQVLGKWPNGMLLARTYYVLGWISPHAPMIPADPSLVQDIASRPTLSLSRRRWLTRAFELMNHPYGWGGEHGGLDCSSFVMEVFKPYGLLLPRHSGHQARALPYSVDVPHTATDSERLALIDHAHHQGIVLLHMPGHVALYLGRDHRNIPMVIHAFTEYTQACDSPSHGVTRMRVHRVTVSTLSLGEGTATGSLLRRIDRISRI